MKHAIAIAVLALAAAAHADEPWLLVSSSSTQEYRIQPGSFLEGTNKSGDAVAIVTGQTIDLRTPAHRTDLYKWYVRLKDCKIRQGILVVTDLNGAYQYESQYVFGAGTHAAILAKQICDVSSYAKTSAKSLDPST